MRIFIFIILCFVCISCSYSPKQDGPYGQIYICENCEDRGGWAGPGRIEAFCFKCDTRLEYTKADYCLMCSIRLNRCMFCRIPFNSNQ